MAMCQSAQPIPAAHLLLQVHYACENDSMCDLCVTVVGQPLNYVCDCLCLYGQIGGSDSVDTPVFMYIPSTLPGSEQTIVRFVTVIDIRLYVFAFWVCFCFVLGGFVGFLFFFT